MLKGGGKKEFNISLVMAVISFLNSIYIILAIILDKENSRRGGLRIWAPE